MFDLHKAILLGDLQGTRELILKGVDIGTIYRPNSTEEIELNNINQNQYGGFMRPHYHSGATALYIASETLKAKSKIMYNEYKQDSSKFSNEICKEYEDHEKWLSIHSSAYSTPPFIKGTLSNHEQIIKELLDVDCSYSNEDGSIFLRLLDNKAYNLATHMLCKRDFTNLDFMADMMDRFIGCREPAIVKGFDVEEFINLFSIIKTSDSFYKKLKVAKFSAMMKNLYVDLEAEKYKRISLETKKYMSDHDMIDRMTLGMNHAINTLVQEPEIGKKFLKSLVLCKDLCTQTGLPMDVLNLIGEQAVESHLVGILDTFNPFLDLLTYNT